MYKALQSSHGISKHLTEVTKILCLKPMPHVTGGQAHVTGKVTQGMFETFNVAVEMVTT